MINSDACVKYTDKICDSQENEVGESRYRTQTDFFPGELETFLPQPPIFQGWTNGITGNVKNSEKVWARLCEGKLKHRAKKLGLRKRYFYLDIVTNKGNAKECSNNCTIALISYAGKVVLKILQVRFQ